MRHASVRYYRPRISGPEQLIENSIVESLHDIFARNDWPVWLGSYVPIGAGFPDVVSVWYDPQVVTLADFQTPDGHILAYLRSVRRARPETVAERLHIKTATVEHRMEWLENSAVISRDTGNSFSLLPAWRQILPEVMAIEAKVSDWQSALQQAIRNRIFAHRSYVALPEAVATRVSSTPTFARYGVGILAVGASGDVRVARDARQSRPSVWSYYFHLAALAAKDLHDRSL